MENEKLVRDKIPTIITEKGGDCEFRIAMKSEYIQLLNKKLCEEVEEFILNPSAEEIADVLEVIETIAKLKNISLEEIKMIKVAKRRERGGFGERVVLINSK